MFASRHPLPRPKNSNQAPPRARYVLSIVHKHRSFASTTCPEKEEEEEGQEQEQGRRHGDPHCVIPLLLLLSTHRSCPFSADRQRFWFVSVGPGAHAPLFSTEPLTLPSLQTTLHCLEIQTAQDCRRLTTQVNTITYDDMFSKYYI